MHVFVSVRALSATDRDRALLLPSGGHFVGDFDEQHQPHGQGVEYHADGSEAASGQWCEGKQHGRGKQILLPSGDRYEGEFVDGKRSGLGSYTWPDGDVDEGEWAGGMLIGLGVRWNKKGKVLECGRWQRDKLAESCPVLRSKIPVGKFLSAAGERHCDSRASSQSSEER